MSELYRATRTAALSVTLLTAIGLPLDSQSPDSIAVDSVGSRLAPVTIGLSAPVRSIGSSRRWLDTTDIRTGAHARTLSELLQARLPGVSVLRYGGDPSDGSRIRMRGATTIRGDASPVVVIDGVPATTPERLAWSLAQNPPSRFDDFDPEEIERVDVLSGVAAAALFGGGASNGAIVVTTKRGVAGRPRWDVWARGDLASEPVSYPANYTQQGINPADGTPVAFCWLGAIAEGQCVPSGQLNVWNPLESASPFRTGRYGAAGASAAGGPFGIKGYASLLGRTETAVLEDSWASRMNARINAERELFGRITIGGNLGYVDRRAKTRFDNIVFRGLTGQATDDANRGYNPLGPGLTPPPTTSKGNRVSRSARVEWRALSWLRIHGVTGKDEVEHRDDVVLPENLGSSIVSRTTLASSIAHGTAEARYRLGRFDARSLLVYEELNRSSFEEQFRVSGSAFSIRRRWSTASGWTVQQRLEIEDRIFVNAGVRRTSAERFGAGDALWQPSVDAVWELGRVRRDVTLQLRGAYAVGMPARDTAFSGIFLQPVGSPQAVIGPAKPREAELGVDATFGSRFALNATLFDTRTPDALVEVPVPQPSQSATALLPVELTNQGVEVIARGRLVDNSATRWTATLTLAGIRNRVSGLPFTFVLLSGAGVHNGEPYGVVHTRPYTFVDANGDGLPSRSEISLGEIVPGGTVIPTREASLRSELAFPQRGLTLSASIDHRGGHRAYNMFYSVHCFFARCRSLQDPSVPVAEKVHVVAGTTVLAPDFAYQESATYTRLGELVLAWTPRWRRTGGLTVAIEARNLFTLSGFDGPDPEVATTMSALPSVDRLAMSPALPRTIGVRVELGTR